MLRNRLLLNFKELWGQNKQMVSLFWQERVLLCSCVYLHELEAYRHLLKWLDHSRWLPSWALNRMWLKANTTSWRRIIVHCSHGCCYPWTRITSEIIPDLNDNDIFTLACHLFIIYTAKCNSLAVWAASGSDNVHRVFGPSRCTRACQRHNSAPSFEWVVGRLNHSGVITKQLFPCPWISSWPHSYLHYEPNQATDDMLIELTDDKGLVQWYCAVILQLQVRMVKFSLSL